MEEEEGRQREREKLRFIESEKTKVEEKVRDGRREKGGEEEREIERQRKSEMKE